MSKYFPNLTNGVDVADVEQIEQAFDLVETDIGAIDPEIKDGSVTTAKIANGAVTTDKIGSDLGRLIESKLSKAQASEALDGKANVSDVYTKTETDGAISDAIENYDAEVMTLLGGDEE